MISPIKYSCSQSDKWYQTVTESAAFLAVYPCKHSIYRTLLGSSQILSSHWCTRAILWWRKSSERRTLLSHRCASSWVGFVCPCYFSCSASTPSFWLSSAASYIGAVLGRQFYWNSPAYWAGCWCLQKYRWSTGPGSLDPEWGIHHSCPAGCTCRWIRWPAQAANIWWSSWWTYS